MAISYLGTASALVVPVAAVEVVPAVVSALEALVVLAE
jgi:hypothetical protein|eukprot:COSAG06_NODE_6575_length_2873_cov_4.285148_2_plen_38_part_00